MRAQLCIAGLFPVLLLAVLLLPSFGHGKYVNIEELYSLIDVLACVFCFCFPIWSHGLSYRGCLFSLAMLCVCFLFRSILYAFYSSFGFLLYLFALICDWGYKSAIPLGPGIQNSSFVHGEKSRSMIVMLVFVLFLIFQFLCPEGAIWPLLRQKVGS